MTSVSTTNQKPMSTPVNRTPQFTQYTLPRKFVSGSKLHRYLAKREPSLIQENKSEYTLFDVLSALRQVISREKLYDPSNTTVIICSQDLENALNVKFLHVTEIRDVVLMQMELLPPMLLASLTPPPPPTNNPQLPVPTNDLNGQQQQQPQANPNGTVVTPGGNNGKFDIEGRYYVKPLFVKVLRKVHGVNPTQVIFTYREVTSYLSQYILDNKEKFFDQRNIKIANVENDPLGIAFGVKVFHRSQVTALLRNQLIPFRDTAPSIGSTIKVKPSASDNGTLIVQRAEIQSNFTASSATQQSTSLKRSAEPDEKEEENALRRTRQRTDSISKQDRESDEETIYSAQGYTTAPMDNSNANDEDHEDNSEHEFDVYEVEYEPEGPSSDEEDTKAKRSKRTKRQSLSSGESDIEDVVIAAATVKVLLENTSSEVTTDDEDSGSDDQDITKYDPENPDSWKCLNCKVPNTPYIRYCSNCYKERKGWLPDRPKPTKKRNSSKAKSTKGQTVKNSSNTNAKRPTLERSLSETTAVSSSTSGKDSEENPSSQDSGFSEETQELNPELPVVSSTDDEEDIMAKAKSLATSKPSMLCTLCCSKPKNACLIHGRISHQVCCYGCAKKLFKSHGRCPVCRRKIEKITKNIIA